MLTRDLPEQLSSLSSRSPRPALFGSAQNLSVIPGHKAYFKTESDTTPAVHLRHRFLKAVAKSGVTRDFSSDFHSQKDEGGTICQRNWQDIVPWTALFSLQTEVCVFCPSTLRTGCLSPACSDVRAGTCVEENLLKTSPQTETVCLVTNGVCHYLLGQKLMLKNSIPEEVLGKTLMS
jgi:hypothetical protein